MADYPGTFQFVPGLSVRALPAHVPPGAHLLGLDLRRGRLIGAHLRHRGGGRPRSHGGKLAQKGQKVTFTYAVYS